MRILLKKVSDDRHALEIARDDGRRESVECETRSYLAHDLLHYAVESEAKRTGGFWGNLANGKTLEELNDRTGKAMMTLSPEVAMIEKVVGALSGVVKGQSAADLAAGLRRYAEASEQPLPGWLTES